MLSSLYFYSLLLENELRLPTMATSLPVIMPLSLSLQRIFCPYTASLCRLVLTTLVTESRADSRNTHHVCGSAIGTEGSPHSLDLLNFLFPLHSLQMTLPSTPRRTESSHFLRTNEPAVPCISLLLRRMVSSVPF